MKLTIITLLLLFTSGIYGQSDKRLKGIDKELNAILKETNAAGFAVAVVVKDKVVYSQGFGYRDVENKLPVDANTLFAIGSCTKSFTSSILGQLRDEGELSFNDNPIDYVPELKFYNDEINSNVIIKDLMSHRTGIPRHDYSWYLFPTTNRDSLLDRIQYHEPFAGLREQWYYNNFMFFTQGVIAERITGKSWEDNIRERFFKPLNMTRSNVSIAELEKVENAAIGYSILKDSALVKEDYYRIGGMAPAGSINSSVNEMSNWVITWINGGKFNGEQVLPEAYVSEAMSSQMAMSGSMPSKEFPDMYMDSYGYAWMMSSYRGHYMVEHGGAIDGFRASTAFFPTDSIGIIVLGNQSGAPVTSLVRKTIADRMLKASKTDWLELYKEEKEKANEAADSMEEEEESNRPKSAHASIDFIGKYDNAGYGEFEITLENDSLYAYFPLFKVYLQNKHYDIFEMFEVEDGVIDYEDKNGLYFNFRTNDVGEISSVDLKLEPMITNPLEFKRTLISIDVDNDVMDSYVGDYDISGATIKVYLKKDVLYLFVAGQPEYELIPTGKHKFTFKILDGFKTEFIEEEGVITAIKLIQPNGTFVAKKK